MFDILPRSLVLDSRSHIFNFLVMQLAHRSCKQAEQAVWFID